MNELLGWCPKLKKAAPGLVGMYERALWVPACEHADAIALAAVRELRRLAAPEMRVTIVGLLREVWASPLTSPTEAVLAYFTRSEWLRGPGQATWTEIQDDAYATLKRFEQLRGVADRINRARRPSVPELATLIREELARTVPGDPRLLAVYQEIALGSAPRVAVGS